MVTCSYGNIDYRENVVTLATLEMMDPMDYLLVTLHHH